MAIDKFRLFTATIAGAIGLVVAILKAPLIAGAPRRETREKGTWRGGNPCSDGGDAGVRLLAIDSGDIEQARGRLERSR